MPGESAALADPWNVPVLHDRLSAFGKRLAERRADILAAWVARGERQLLTFTENVSERTGAEARAEISRVLAA